MDDTKKCLFQTKMAIEIDEKWTKKYFFKPLAKEALRASKIIKDAGSGSVCGMHLLWQHRIFTDYCLKISIDI